MAAALNRPLIFGLFFAFGWESWVPLLPGSFQKVSVMTYLRALAPHPEPEGVPNGLAGLLAAFSPESVTQSTARWVLVLLVLICLGGALLVFSNREYAPKEDAE